MLAAIDVDVGDKRLEGAFCWRLLPARIAEKAQAQLKGAGAARAARVRRRPTGNGNSEAGRRVGARHSASRPHRSGPRGCGSGALQGARDDKRHARPVLVRLERLSGLEQRLQR